MKPLLLEMRNVKAWYGGVRVLHGVSIEMEQGSITALLGANGAGKTTTLRALCGMVRTEGQINLEGSSIQALSTEDIVRRGVAHVPDGRGTFTHLTTHENLVLGAYTRRNKEEVLTDVERMYLYFPRLKERYRQQAGTLSGGEQQMLAISRALMLRPRLLLLDEPSFGVAPKVVSEIFAIMRRINEEGGMSILVVEQNASIALELADHAYLIETGKPVLSGPADDIRQNDLVRRSYLGY